jgi:polyribonucleotide nucleotidyltransferase
MELDLKKLKVETENAQFISNSASLILSGLFILLINAQKSETSGRKPFFPLTVEE